MIFSWNLGSGHCGLRQPPAIAPDWKQAPVASPGDPLATGEKLLHAINANILSGSVDARDPCLGGAVADIGGFRQKSASFELLQPGLRLRDQGRYSGGRSRQMTFVVSYYLLPIS
jgi:hypothetical protein